MSLAEAIMAPFPYFEASISIKEYGMRVRFGFIATPAVFNDIFQSIPIFSIAELQSYDLRSPDATGFCGVLYAHVQERTRSTRNKRNTRKFLDFLRVSRVLRASRSLFAFITTKSISTRRFLLLNSEKIAHTN
jgi:hypothetical protein